jgi:GAF domain-containing protein
MNLDRAGGDSLPPGLAELSRIALSDDGLTAALQRITDVAQRVFTRVEDVSVTVVDEGGKAETVAFSGELAVHLDERQYENGFGPCMDAAVTGQTVVVNAADPVSPYTEFAGACVKAGITHSVSVALPMIPTSSVGALNVYASTADGLSQETVAGLELFAIYAAVAVANAAKHDQQVQLATQLQDAMRTRAVIEQAKGILMATHRIPADEAFQALTRASQRENKKLNTIAQRLVDNTLSSS